MHGDVHAGPHLAVPAPDRRDDRPQAVRQFLVDQRVPLAAHPARFRAQACGEVRVREVWARRSARARRVPISASGRLRGRPAAVRCAGKRCRP
ncbi:hypothetical protein SHO565_51570 [Streptomyces sp. HO565]